MAPDVASNKPYNSAPLQRVKMACSAPTHQAPSDPYHGHKDTAVTCANFVIHLFACPETSSLSLSLYIAYALYRTRLPHSVPFAALYLLLRLKFQFPDASANSVHSGHRLFISTLIIASKIICDDTYSNFSWTIVGQGLFALSVINRMEREMCHYLGWNLNVDPKELREFEEKVRRDFKGAGPYPNYSLPSSVHEPTPGATSYVADLQAPLPTFVSGQLAAPSVVSTEHAPSRHHSRLQSIIVSVDGPLALPREILDTPEASHSLSTSPASSIFPITPPNDGENEVKIVFNPNDSAPMSVVRSLSAVKVASSAPPSMSTSTCSTYAARVVSSAPNPRNKQSGRFAVARPITW